MTVPTPRSTVIEPLRQPSPADLHCESHRHRPDLHTKPWRAQVSLQERPANAHEKLRHGHSLLG